MPSINTELGERALSKMQHEMDWKPLKERCLRVYPTWSSRHADRVLREYQRFLALKVATRDIYDTIVLAPQLLDAIWRQHILSTQQYYADCQMLLQANQILHYNADASLNVRQSVKEKRMELTKASLCMMFSGMYPPPSEANGIWDYDDKQESTMNSGVSSVADDDHEDTSDDFATGTEEDETESLPPPSPKARNPRKERERQRKSKTIPIMKAQTMEHAVESKEERRRLIYIYRAGKVSKLNTHTQETIKSIKAKIHRKIGLTPQQQLLEWDGLALDEDRTIGQYGIPNDSTLVLSKVRADEKPKSKLKQKQKQQPIHTKGDETPIEDADESVDSTTHDDEARDQPDDWHKRRSVSPGRRNGSPNRRRSHTKSPPPTPRSPRPPRPPRKHDTPTHPPPYSPTIHEDDSYISTSGHSVEVHNEKRSDVRSSLNSELQSVSNSEIHSAVVHHSPIRSVGDDPRRRQQALLNKMKIQSHDQQEDHHSEVHRLHRQEDSSIEPQSTLPSRPRLKPTHPINVFVNTIMGFTITLTAKANDTVDHLKQLIEAQEDIPFRKQILILDGVPLNDSRLLSDYTSDGGSSLHVLLRLQAGKASTNSVTTSSFAASSMSPLGSSSAMMVEKSVTRKKNQNRIMMSRAPPGSSTANHTGVGTGTKWR